jgi:flagellar P-ring protein precursor FlgI
MTRTLRIVSLAMAALLALPALAAPAVPKTASPGPDVAILARTQPLRNLVSVEGVRENPLVGYGLVVGLNGSGDSTQVKYSSQSVVNMLKQFGVKLPDGEEAKNKNVAAVMVSAVFPPGYRRGQQIDVTVSSLGDAKSLRGGTLLLTQLRAADNEIYALAQGNLVVGGLSAAGKSGSSVTVNTPTSGRIPNGAQIEREIPTDFATRPAVLLRLRHPNFDTATNVVNAINRRFGEVATTADGTSVEVVAPTNPTERVAFVAKLENMAVEAGEEVPRVVFNSRTGTVVISDGLRVKSAAVTHGSLKVVISESSAVSQPGPFSKGQTQVTPQSKVSVDQGSGQMFHWPAGARLQTIIDTVNSLGASPDDIMAILQALDQAGAIEGELVVI